jgi:hypothetical protein
MKDCERLREAKSKMKRRLEVEILRMRNYCRINQISNRMISDKCGLATSHVWRFINRTSPEMTMINFLLVAEGIGYDFKFAEPSNLN